MSKEKEAMMTLINYRRMKQKLFDDSMKSPINGNPELDTELIKEEYAIALSIEPSMEDINNLPSEHKKGTEVEKILMELRILPQDSTKNRKQ